jgi:hypothetical protein
VNLHSGPSDTLTYFGGGGGGMGYFRTRGEGGKGGGGDGGQNAPFVRATGSGDANTGGGGGGDTHGQHPSRGNGGSGVVMIRYKKTDVSASGWPHIVGNTVSASILSVNKHVRNRRYNVLMAENFLGGDFSGNTISGDIIYASNQFVGDFSGNNISGDSIIIGSDDLGTISLGDLSGDGLTNGQDLSGGVVGTNISGARVYFDTPFTNVPVVVIHPIQTNDNDNVVQYSLREVTTQYFEFMVYKTGGSTISVADSEKVYANYTAIEDPDFL